MPISAGRAAPNSQATNKTLSRFLLPLAFATGAAALTNQAVAGPTTDDYMLACSKSIPTSVGSPSYTTTIPIYGGTSGTYAPAKAIVWRATSPSRSDIQCLYLRVEPNGKPPYGYQPYIRQNGAEWERAKVTLYGATGSISSISTNPVNALIVATNPYGGSVMWDPHGAQTLTWDCLGLCTGSAATINVDAAGGSTPQPITPEAGWWWNADESGRGYSIEVRNGTLFMAIYGYDAASGNATWHITSGKLNGNRFEGSWQQFGGGQSLTGTYRKPSVTGSGGNVTLVFSDTRNATLTLPDGRQIPITRFEF